MTSRLNDRKIFENKEEIYESLRESRGVRKVVHYSTPVMPSPKTSAYDELTMVRHTWSVGDRLYKLSFKHYGTTKYWWVIARFNGTPTEAHISIGDSLDIPLPLDKALTALERGE